MTPIVPVTAARTSVAYPAMCPTTDVPQREMGGVASAPATVCASEFPSAPAFASVLSPAPASAAACASD